MPVAGRAHERRQHAGGVQLMRKRRGADDGRMGTQSDQPWMVLARRPASLAALLQSERERMHGDQSQVDHEGLDESQLPVGDIGTPPVPPAIVD